MAPPSILDQRPEVAELHVHLGGAVDPAIMWSIAHQQGIRLPSKDYWQFVELITVSYPDKVNNLAEYDQIFRWTELIQSSPLAIERSVYEVIGGAYRKCNITTLELRFNPMKRNREGEQDLDHIISAAIRGQDRALMEYPQMRSGLILMMDRTFPLELNAIIVEKALRYRGRGIIGIDIAGPPNPRLSPIARMRGWWNRRATLASASRFTAARRGESRICGRSSNTCGLIASAMGFSVSTTSA